MGGTPASAQLGVRLTRLRDLPDALERLTGAARERAERLLEVSVVTGATNPPPELEPWLIATFGSIEDVRTQTIVKVANPVTLEATIFAPLRARRPSDGPFEQGDAAARIAATEGDPFCHPETGTPAETNGRVRGTRVVTGANAALADAHHAVIVFDTHDPLGFDTELVADVLRTGRAWADRAHAADPAAVNYLLVWNCLWRAGGSIIHGHAQALLGSGRHYGRLDRLRHDVAAYARAHEGGDLVEELVAVHRSLGLTIELADGVTLVANLTPIKERELLVVGSAGMEETDERFVSGLARTLIAYRDRIGVRSFNLALWRPPLGDVAGWELVPPLVRIVDRGDLAQRPSDIGAMELYATPVVGNDPYELIEALS
jgi:hypothetical protein